MTKKKTAKKRVIKKKSKTKKRKRRIIINEIKPDQILLRDRTILLFDGIDNKVTKDIVGRILALDILGKERIVLKINSGGGLVLGGYAIIDAMNHAQAPIVTWITGMAASMAGIISIQGKVRLMSKNSIWMAHPIHSGMIDYLPMMKDRRVYHDLIERQGEEIFKKFTKLTAKEIVKAQNGELWFTAEQCLKKGIVDQIV